MNSERLIGTGTSYGALPLDTHARQAVLNALKQVSGDDVGSVLLFLSGGYAHQPQNAIKEAVKAAGTPLVFGCTAAGLLCDQEWLIDVEGAVAMVFSRELGLQPLAIMQQSGIEPTVVLNLSSPNAATIGTNSVASPQIGAISSDEFGHGPYSVWQSGRIVEREYCHAAFSPTLAHSTQVCEGIRRLSPTMRIDRAEGHRLFEIEQRPAVDNLLRHLPENLHKIGLEQPYNLLCGISENDQLESIQQGHYVLHHVVSTLQSTDNDTRQEIHISGQATAGKHMFWALRDPELAKINIRKKLLTMRESLTSEPLFALMFPNISRGPEFYSGPDCDFDIFKEIFPDTPLIGFYGNGEIIPGHREPALIHHYTTAVTVFT